MEWTDGQASRNSLSRSLSRTHSHSPHKDAHGFLSLCPHGSRASWASPLSLSLSLFFFLCFSERPRSAACLPANPLIHRNSELSFYPTLERKNNQLILIYSIPRRILLLYIFSFFFFFLKEKHNFSLSLLSFFM
jgi:hypothetical protein